MHHKAEITNPVLTLLFLALVFCLPIPLGGNRVWAVSVIEICIFLLTFFTVYSLHRKQYHLPRAIYKARPIFIMALVFLLWNFIQVLPLGSFIPLSSAFDSNTIAIDTQLAGKKILLNFTYVLFLFLMLILIDSRRKLEWLAYTIVAAGLFQAAYGSFMSLTGIEYTFFVEKESYRGSATGTFINRNHLAGYLEISLAIGIGLMISKLSNHQDYSIKDYFRSVLNFLLGSKILIRIILIITCIGLILSHSRMGNMAFFSSLLISGLTFIIISRHATRKTVVFLSSIIILDIFLMGSWVGINKVVERIEGTSIESELRDEVARDTLRLIAEQPLAGIGAGNYYLALPRFQQADITSNYYHAHNDYLELTSEYGLIGTMPLALIVLYSLFQTLRTMRKKHSTLRLGMAFASFMGIISILIHSSVDFNLQIPANATMFVLLIGLSLLSASLDHHQAHYNHHK